MAPGAYRVSGDFDSESRRKKDYRLESRYHRDSDLNRRDLVGANCRDSNSRNSSNGFSHADNYQKYPPRSRSPVVRKKPYSDRELGELSSGSESEKLDMRREISRSKENGHRTANKETKETGPSPSKKRKFSPIVWSKTKNEGSVAQSLPNSLPSPPLAKSPMDLDLEVSVNSPRNPCINGDREPGQIEEEDELYPTTRTISSSRWAEIDDELERETSKKVSSPEPGDSIIRESSVITVSRSSNSDREEREDDSMEIDRENGTDHESDSEFEREDTPEPEKPAHRSINMLEGCRSVDEFERLNKINEGTYGVVFRARDKKTGEIVALKKIKMERETEGFPLTSLREINILLSFHHSYIVDVKEVVMGSSLDSIFMVMEYMEHDLKGVMEAMKQPYSQSEVKCLMIQLLEGVKYLHDNWVLHRDLKTSNLLLNNNGELKICDFGMARQYGSPLKPYTQLVVTLWYRAPELLLGGKEYSTAVDMWSIGCIMAELLTKQPLFAGESEIDQVGKIFKVLGTPSEEIWPGYKKLPGSKVRYATHKSRCNTFAEKLKSYKSSNAFSRTFFHDDSTLSKKGFELLDRLLTYDPKKRISAEEALEHPWFKEVPLPKSKDFMPTFPSQNDKDRRKKALQGDIIGSRGLFG